MTPPIVSLSGYALVTYVVVLGLFATGSIVAKHSVAFQRHRRSQQNHVPLSAVDVQTKPVVETEISINQIQAVVQPWLLVSGPGKRPEGR